MPESKLEKIKRAVEKTELETRAEVLKEEELARRRELDEIVAKLKEKQKKGFVAEKRLEKIKEHVEEKPEISEEETKAAIRLQVSKTKGVGWFYSSLQKPITSVSKVFSVIPVAKNLKKELASADMHITPEAYLALTTTVSVIAAITTWIAAGILATSLSNLSVIEIASSISLAFVGAVLAFFGVSAVALAYPSIRASERANKIDKELPFALRHLATQLKAGVSLNRAMRSVADANYGALTQEFRKTLADLESGLSTEDALLKLADRNRSRGLKRAVVQITRAIRTGGNLAEIISSIADDISFESRMKIRDFTEMLNIISIVYIMVGVVAPVMITILSAVAQLPVFGGGIAFGLVLAVFAGIVGATGALIFLIKRLEPVA
ncbi:MAG: type II secretion system F family protein [Candidatus Micrarchaeia archaeon]|jgi:flagellar protein FlaJ